MLFKTDEMIVVDNKLSLYDKENLDGKVIMTFINKNINKF